MFDEALLYCKNSRCFYKKFFKAIFRDLQIFLTVWLVISISLKLSILDRVSQSCFVSLNLLRKFWYLLLLYGFMFDLRGAFNRLKAV